MDTGKPHQTARARACGSRRTGPTAVARPLRRIRWALALTLSCLATSVHAAEQDAAALFARYKDRIFQIRVIDVEAEKKSALGTGFLVAQDGLIATNFHVVSGLVNRPGKYRLEYFDEREAKGDLTLLDIDVVNDLALLRAEDLDQSPLELADSTPNRGDTIYSLGNPYDIGFSVVPGIYNGIDERSYYRNILFSGSLNAGMSGGPVLDQSGGVVGVNVSSAGNEISFLVPGEALRSLIDESQAHAKPVADLQARVLEQLQANQAQLIEGILAAEWPTQPLGEATVVGELRPFVKCWGNSSNDDDLYRFALSSCRSDRKIFLGSRFNTGVIAYQFFWLEAHELQGPRFLNYYRSIFDGFLPDNEAGEDDVGEFACEEMFVHDDAQHTDKAVLCVRAYRNYAPLYDVLYLRGSVDESDKAFISHFTLAGVGRDSIASFLEKFQRVARR
jgi:S1-C subfamily serine protease